MPSPVLLLLFSGGFEWDFDVMLREKKAEKKRKRKRRENGIDIINDDDGIIAHMVNAMKNAAKVGFLFPLNDILCKETLFQG